MKRFMLIMCLAVCCGCAAAGGELETETEIKVGQVWKWTFNGAEREILEVGEKYVVFCYKEGYKSPDVETHEDFLEDHKLTEDIEIDTSGVLWYTSTETFTIDNTTTDVYFIESEPKKPYLHKNPNNDHWICSKHGDLDRDKGKMVVSFKITRVAVLDTTYCDACYWEVQVKFLNQHITGVKENDQTNYTFNIVVLFTYRVQ